MAKKKKNGNYVTAKTEAAKADKIREAKRKKAKKIITATLVVILVAAIIAGITLGIGFGFGLFEYTPEVTYHASIEIQDYGTLHVELYGNEAPTTVNNFIMLAQSGHYNGKSFYKIIDDLIYGAEDLGDKEIAGIKGEFSENGVENKISHTRGTLSMARGEGKNSAYSEFFIVRKNSRELDGKCAAFGRVTSGMEIIDKIFDEARRSESGVINYADRAIITKIETHHAHD